MRRLRVFVVLGQAVLVAGCSGSPAEPAKAYTPGLGEIMTLNQMRHAKLWFAGEAGNWPLASYELDEIQEGLDDAVLYHPTHKDAPMRIADLIPAMTKAPIATLREAIASHDVRRFEEAFDGLTASCNACHKAADFAFNVVRRPATNPYPNQVFEPAP
jgi:hypothetical protein